MNPGAGRRRTTWSIAGIIAVCVTAVAVTAVLVRHTDPPTSSDQAPSATAATPTAAADPDDAEVLLDQDRVGEIVGTTVTVVPVGQNLSPPGVAADVSVSECAWFDWIGPAVAYADVEWSGLRRSLLKNTAEDKSISQQAVRVDTLEAGRQVLDNIRQYWQTCREKPYTNKVIGEYTLVLTEVRELDDLVIAHREIQGMDWVCERAVAVKASYVLEANTCNLGSSKIETIAREMMANVEE